MHYTRLTLAGLLLSASLAAAGQAQEPTPGETDPIVVTGTATPEEIAKASHAMTRTLTAATVGDQVARWTEPLCPRVEGLSDENGSRVRETMLAVASEAKVRVGKARCNPNVIVIFSKDAKDLAVRIADRLPPSEDRKTSAQRSAFTGGASGPLRWESRVSLQDTRRGPMAANSAALMGSGDYKLNIDVPTTDSFDPSLIKRPTKASIDGMIVLVDGDKAEGMGLDQLSEYIAMVVLTRPPMAASFATHPSILNLAAYRPPGPSSLRLSEWDRAFIKALYGAPADRSAAAARSIIAKRMIDTLEKE